MHLYDIRYTNFPLPFNHSKWLNIIFRKIVWLHGVWWKTCPFYHTKVWEVACFVQICGKQKKCELWNIIIRKNIRFIFYEWAFKRIIVQQRSMSSLRTTKVFNKNEVLFINVGTFSDNFNQRISYACTMCQGTNKLFRDK